MSSTLLPLHANSFVIGPAVIKHTQNRNMGEIVAEKKRGESPRRAWPCTFSRRRSKPSTESEEGCLCRLRRRGPRGGALEAAAAHRPCAQTPRRAMVHPARVQLANSCAGQGVWQEAHAGPAALPGPVDCAVPRARAQNDLHVRRRRLRAQASSWWAASVVDARVVAPASGLYVLSWLSCNPLPASHKMVTHDA